jgi:hypothetical protein
MSDALIFKLDYELPPRADELGELFAALSRDYRTMTKGRELVVVRLDNGSVIGHFLDWACSAGPYVKDAIEAAKGTKALYDFAKLLRDAVVKVKGKKAAFAARRKSTGQKTIEAGMKIAARTKGTFEFKYTSPEGEVVEAKMTHTEVLEVIPFPAPAKPIRAEIETGVSGAVIQQDVVKQAIGRLYDHSGSASQSEKDGIVETLVSVLMNAKLDYLIEVIANDLSQKGMHSVAANLLQKGQGWRSQEPPFTTS